jgi:hypothetical protein
VRSEIEGKNKSRNGLYYKVYEWMKQVVPCRHLRDTYACVWTMTQLDMCCSATAIAKRLNLSEVTVRRHLRGLTKLGVWRVQRRSIARMTVSNRYWFYRAPAMPDDVASARHVIAAQEPRVTHAREGTIAGDREGMSLVTGDRKIRMRSERHASTDERDAAIPLDLLLALKKVAPRHVDDCERLVRRETRDLSQDDAKQVVLVALQQLIEAVERGGVRNPPGLLYKILKARPEPGGSSAEHNANPIVLAIRALDSALLAPRSAFHVRRTTLKRVQLYRRLCELLGTAPSGVSAVPDLEGELGQLAVRMLRAQLASAESTARGDGVSASRRESEVNDLERELERFFSAQKGAAE